MAAGQFAAGQDSPPPVLIGFGIDTPARAAAAARHADGVIVASALMRRVLDGADASDIARTVGDLRSRDRHRPVSSANVPRSAP